MRYTDNGYQEWYDNKNNLKKKRRKPLFISISIIILLSLIVYFFGFDSTVATEEKTVNTISGLIGLLVINFIIINFKYKIPKFIKKCNKCGNKIKNIKNNCIIGKIKYIGTVDKTGYETIKSTTTGTTEYLHGGYAIKNQFAKNRTSNSIFKTYQKIPVVKKHYRYEKEYKCKNCNELFCRQLEDYLEPIDNI